MRRHARLRPFLLAVVLVVAAEPGSAIRSTARFTSTAGSGVNAFTTGTWAWVLHNRPTPPTGNTTSQIDLAMDATASTATVLYAYSTDAGGDLGRILQRSSLALTETNAKHYADWWGPRYAVARTYRGNALLQLWAQPRTNGTAATLSIYLRDRSSGGVAEITALTYVADPWPTGKEFTFLAVPISVSWTFAAGHWLELRLMAPGTSKNDIVVAYDTTTYSSFLRMP